MRMELYPGIPFSPQTTLSDAIGAADTIIPVSDVSAFPDAPNLATIGVDENGETILYAAKTETALSGCLRGVEGMAKTWPMGEAIARNFTAKDHDDLISAVSASRDAAAEAQAGVDNLSLEKQDILSGQSGQIVGFDASHSAIPLTIKSGANVTLKQEGAELEIGAVVPGKNLLINSDFRRPVNRNGKTEYLSEWTYSIDQWLLPGGSTLSIHDGYISLTFSADQILEDFLPGQYTASVLTTAGLLTATVAVFNSDLTEETYINLPSIGFFVFVPNSGWRIRIQPESGYRNLIAAIVEKGDHQTHFRQNADGEWEVIDPPDYDLQYLLCSQYSPTTGEWVGLQHSNTQMLDNAYWANKDAIIKQLGQEEYTSFGYTIDRWHIDKNLKINIYDGYIKCSRINESNNDFTGFLQRIEDDISGEKTLSIMMSGEGSVKIGEWGKAISEFTLNESFEVYSITTKVSLADVGVFLTGAVSANIKAAKLEPGPVQTLAHKEGDTWVLNDPPPNKALELLKCQRYYLSSYINNPPGTPQTFENELVLIAIKNDRFNVNGIEFPVRMRITPNVTFYAPGSGNPGYASESGSSNEVRIAIVIAGPDRVNIGAPDNNLVVGHEYYLHYVADARL